MNQQKTNKIILTILLLTCVLLVLTACSSRVYDPDELEQALTPTGVASWVQALYNLVGNYGWTMVVFTLLLKVVMLPLEIWQKVATKKMAYQQMALQPMKEAIERQYGANSQKANEELQKLYKKQGVSMLASCLPTIATMMVFIFMFTGVNQYSRYRNYSDYMELYEQYQAYYSENIDAGMTNEQAVSDAEERLYVYYTEEVQEQWLWIKNVWRPDTWEKSMADFADFAQSVGMSTAGGSSAVGDMQANYEIVYRAIVTNGYNGWNGYMILPLLCTALSFLAMWLPQLFDKKQGLDQVQNQQQASTNKTMMFMMPLMMAFFGFVYTGAFAIYITCNYLLNLISTFALRVPVEKLAKRSALKQQQQNQPPKASYKR